VLGMEFLGDGGFTTHVCKTFTVCGCVPAKEEQTEKGGKKGEVGGGNNGSKECSSVFSSSFLL